MAAAIRVMFRQCTQRYVQTLLQPSRCETKHKLCFHNTSYLFVVGQEIRMPSLSPTMSEGTIVKWLKQEGDPIAPGDVLCDIQTDKAVVSFETEEEGILAKILVPENSKDIKVGTLIGLMVGEGEDWKSVEVSPSAGISTSAPASGGKDDSGGQPGAKSTFKTSNLTSYGPAVRQLLMKYDLKSDQISPTGYRSKLLKEDVLKYITTNKLTEKPLKAVKDEGWLSLSAKHSMLNVICSHDSSSSSESDSDSTSSSDSQEESEDKDLSRKPQSVSLGVWPFRVPLPSKVAGAKAPASKPAPAKPQVKKTPGTGFDDIEVSTMRRTIAKRLTESKRQIPHSFTSVQCPIDKILEMRKDMKKDGITVSINDFVIKAVAHALQQCPEVNAHCIGDQVTLVPNIDISIAVATDTGLITPIVKDAASKGLIEISSVVKELALKAREGKLQPHEFQGGSFTISNLGMFGVKEFSAIINPPQCAILAVGGGQDILGEDGNSQTKITVTLSYDRRAIDEGLAAEFLEVVRNMLENPAIMLLGGHQDLRAKLGL
ncbi:pyruvate dehydrogenase protein X component isoform X1 [Anabrus simplex]|uniref:pyruvate dehydrogenase protein X component isoform X1 n=1 Tax=Anabrus simplex TaxID=316456 RepID=UPI0035A2849D